MKLVVKTITVIASISAASVFAFSTYVGIDTGLGSMNVNQNLTYKTLSGDHRSSQRQYQAYGAAVNGFVGIGQSFKRLYLGVEANYDYAAASATATVKRVRGFNTDVKVTEKLGASGSISLVSGWFISGTNFVFLKGGVALGSMSSKSDPTNSPNYPHMADDLGYSGNFNKTLFGYSIGAGFESYFSHNLSLRVEYNYTQYQNFEMHQKSGASFLMGPATFKYAPSSSTVLAGITWHLPLGNDPYPNFGSNQVLISPQAQALSSDDGGDDGGDVAASNY